MAEDPAPWGGWPPAIRDEPFPTSPPCAPPARSSPYASPTGTTRGWSSATRRPARRSTTPASPRTCSFVSNFDTVLAAYTHDPVTDTFDEVASNNDEPGGAGPGSPSIVTFPIADGEECFIAVDGVEGATGDVALQYTLAQPRPDARVRVGTAGTLRGNDLYGTLTGQTATGQIPPGGTVTFHASVQNDASLAERLKLQGQPTSGRFTLRYRSPGGVNITNQVTAGTFQTALLAPNATYVLRMEVTLARTASNAASLSRTLRARSTVDPTVSDTVRFTSI